MKNKYFRAGSILFILVVLVFISFTHKSDAGWTEQSSSGSQNWYAITSSSDGTKLAAVAWGSYVYTSTDSGSTWTERTGPGAHEWSSITSSADGTKLAIANQYGYLYTSSDNGATWTSRTIGSNTLYKISSVSYSSDGANLFATDYGGYIYRSINEGLTWTKQTSSGSRNWQSIAVSSDGMKLAAVVYTGNIYTSSDSGTTWIKSSGSLTRSWKQISMSSDGTKLAAVVYDGNIYTSSDSGTTWIERTSAGSNEWSSIASSSNGVNLIAAADGNYVYTSSDSGVTWTPQINIGIKSWRAVASSSYGTKLIVANSRANPNAYIYTYNSLTVSPTVATNAASSLSGNATTLNGTISNTGGDIIITRGFNYGSTTDYGTTMAENGYFNIGPYSGFTTPPTCGGGTYHYRAYATNSSGTVYGEDQSFTTTACNLATWIQQTGAPAVLLTSIASSSDGMKLAALGRADYYAPNQYIYTSIDGGTTWTRRDNAGFLSWSSIASSADGTKLVVASYAGTGGKYIYTSSNGGDSWTQRTSAGSKKWWSVASSADGTKLVAAENSTDCGYIYISSNSGVDWTRTTTPYISWRAVASSSDGNKLIASTDGEGTYTSSNGGTTWTQSTTRSGNISSSSGGDKLVISVYSGYIYTSSDSGATWIERTGAGIHPWRSVKYSSSGTKIIVADASVDGTSGHVYVSSDDGLSWVVQDSIGSSGFSSVELSSDGSKLMTTSNSSPYPLYTYGVVLDTTAPTTTDNTNSTIHNSSVVITLTCNDGNGSGCQKTYYTTDGSTPTNSSSSETTIILSNEGMYTIKYFSIDNSNNSEIVKTSSNTVVIDKTAPDISEVTSRTLTNSSTTITWTTDEASSSWVDYGLTNNYGLLTTEINTDTMVTSHSVPFSDLESCTTYYYRVNSKDSATNESIGDMYSFTTLGCTAAASILDSSSEKMTIEAGGTLTLEDGNLNGLTLDVPISFADADATFQAHQLDKDTVIESISTPTNYLATNGYIYELKALTDDSTVVSVFDNPLTISLNYNTDDIFGLDESSLKIYSWDGSTWSLLSNCLVNIGTNTITCDTSHFSTFGLFGLPSVVASISTYTRRGGSMPLALLNQQKQNIVPTTTIEQNVQITKIIFKKDLKYGQVSSDVKLLQQYLNNNGFTVAKTGVGSKGKENNRFGPATKAALIKFQKAKGIKPAVGYFGPVTREYIK